MLVEKFCSVKMLVLFLFAVFTVSFYILNPVWQIRGDGHGYYLYLRSLYFDNDLDFNNEIARYDKLYDTDLSQRALTSMGKIGNPFAIGWAIFLSPFFLLARGFDVIGGATHNDLLGFSAVYQLFLGFGSVFYAIIGAVFLFDALRRLFSQTIAWLTTVAVILCSPLLHYIIYEPLMSHNLAFFAGCVLFWYAIRIWQSEKIDWKDVFTLGIIGGAIVLIRWEHAIFLLLPFCLLFQKWRGNILTKLSALAVSAVVAGVLFIPQLWAWHCLYGGYFLVPQGSDFINYYSPHFFSVLFSSYHGLFSWHPFLFLGLAGVCAAWKKSRGLAVLLLAVFLLETYLHGSLKDWWGGSAFGARKMCGLLFIFAYGIAHLFFISKKPMRMMLAVICLLFAGWNVLLMTAAPRGLISIGQPVSFTELFKAPINNALLILK